MGRSGKRGANQRNTKNENGIVDPGKRVTKQKSNGHLNGSADGNPEENAPSVPALPSQNLTVPTKALTVDNASATKARSLNGPRQSLGRTSLVANSDDVDDLESGDGAKMGELQHRKIDVNSAKQTTAPESGSLHLALTVLRSCPLSDTLAILIFLLSLPPTFLHLTNAMFAMLTFVPPSGSFTALPSLTDITSSFSPATPSFIVLVLIDFLAISLWYMIPFPQLQGMLLDCAQATVATTLGGGYTYRPGASDNILLMVTVVLATHLGRYRKTTLRWLHKTPLAKWLPVVDSFDAFDDMPPRPSYMLGTNRTWLDTIKIWVAVHILFQGLTRMVRRSLHNSRGTSIFSTQSKSIDPEAVSNPPAGELTESLHNPPSSPSIIKSKSSLQNLRDVREKISIGKRRRKQANHVRSQQPLWAAFAATKATIMREYDQSQAARDARGSHAEGVENLGSAPFAQEDNRIWITEICPEKFYFETGPIPRGKSVSEDGQSVSNLEDEAGIDPSKFFFVRINRANWASVKIIEAPDSEGTHGRLRWFGEVYGLSPASTYRVSFTKCEDGVELHSEVIVTPSSPIPEQASVSTPAPPQSLRPPSPESPAATLKTTIANFESSLSDTLSQQKRIRKEDKANTGALSKELNTLTEKLARYATGDKSFAARKQQLEQNINQADEATASISVDIEVFSEIPEEASTEWQEQKANWEQIRNEQSRVQEDLQRTKEENRKNHTAAQAEALNVGQKKERLQSRATKLTEQYKRLTSSAVTPDSRRTQFDPSLRHATRSRIENRYLEQIGALERSYQDKRLRYQAITSQRNALEQAAEDTARQQAAQQAQQARLQFGSRSVTPEGDLPGTNPNVSKIHAQPHHRFGMFNTPESQSVTPASAFGSAGANDSSRNASHRRRSQSAISGGSKYLDGLDDDDDDDDPIPAQHKRKSGTISNVLENSDGRSSGSSGSPRVPSVPLVPPIGFRGNQSPAAGS